MIRKKMYPLIPLQLFSLRKEIGKAYDKNDINKLNELSVVAKNLAIKHKMLLAIQNLIEYLNRNYLNDHRLEEEVNNMTKTLYDPEVEKRGIEKGRIEGSSQKEVEIVLNMLSKGLDEDMISSLTNIDIEKVKEIRVKHMN